MGITAAPDDQALLLELQEFDLRACIEETLDLFANAAAEKGLGLAYQIDDACPATCVSDPTRLRQILANLVSNAVKFTERGSVSLHAFVTHREANKVRLRFEVRDTGIGMSPEQQGKLFLAFQQADVSTTRTHGGTGLGLAIVKHVLQRHGASLDITSELGKGSTFSVTFPANRLR